jgi:hypothetical protein
MTLRRRPAEENISGTQTRAPEELDSDHRLVRQLIRS